MDNWVQIVPLVGASGVAGWAGNAALQWMKARGDREQARDTAEIDLSKHRDKLMFDVLTAAQAQLAAANAKAAELGPLQVRNMVLEATATHLSEAIEHLKMLIAAKGPDERALAERMAQAFVIRMHRLSEAHGAMANEAQIITSKAALDARPKPPVS